MRRFSSLFLLASSALLAPVIACTDPVDKAAKQRIFSEEDPPKVVASAKEQLAANALAEDPKVARRVIEMGASEAVERLGPSRYESTVTFEWSAQSGASNKLTEKRTLLSSSGGVNGDFDAKVTNSRSLGLEVIRVGGKVYASNTYGKFRLRARDRGMAERTREDVYGALREFSSLVGERMKLTSQGTATYEGRSANKYEVSLGDASKAPAAKLPKQQVPKGGDKDEGTKRRQYFLEKRQVRALSGEVLVDSETAVVLKAHLEAKVDVPAQGANSAAGLHLSVESALTQIGKPPALKVPADALPDADKPSGIAEALDRFGIPRANKADGGTSQKEDEPGEEE